MQDSENVHAWLAKLGVDVATEPPNSLDVLTAYWTWGKGRHPAGLNFGDCFAYDTAKTHACPLLYVGDDFRKTDLQSVL